jgi:hypothetical protein
MMMTGITLRLLKSQWEEFEIHKKEIKTVGTGYFLTNTFIVTYGLQVCTHCSQCATVHLSMFAPILLFTLYYTMALCLLWILTASIPPNHSH